VDLPDRDERLSRVETQWTLLFRAGPGPDRDAAAQQQLLLRYYAAAYRYLLGMVRDPAAAEELTQEFAVRFLRGDCRRADPGRGRFRDFLKTALRHLVIDHWRKRGREPALLPPDAVAEAAAAPAELEALDQQFLQRWREELLAQTWGALQAVQEETGQPFHTVLRWKAEAQGLSAAELADRLGAAQGRAYSEVAARKLLQRARQRFAELLVEEVARSLPCCTPAELEQELIDLDLLSYCRSALQHRAESP
jgi:RNA polymerase sigma-70 factor (ECF subfamily)